MVVFIAAGLFDGIMDTAGDMAFVIRIMALVYIIYWLFVTFNENMTLFGLAAVIVSYFMLFHSPIVIIIAVLILLVVFGSQLQMSLQFGLLQPMQQVHMEEAEFARERAAEAAQIPMSKLNSGVPFEELTEFEQQAVLDSNQMPQGGGMPAQQLPMRRPV